MRGKLKTKRKGEMNLPDFIYGLNEGVYVDERFCDFRDIFRVNEFVVFWVNHAAINAFFSIELF